MRWFVKFIKWLKKAPKNTLKGELYHKYTRKCLLLQPNNKPKRRIFLTQ